MVAEECIFGNLPSIFHMCVVSARLPVNIACALAVHYHPKKGAYHRTIGIQLRTPCQRRNRGKETRENDTRWCIPNHRASERRSSPTVLHTTHI